MQAIQNTVNTQSQIIRWCVARRNNRYSLDTYKTFLIAIQMLQDEEKSKTLLIIEKKRHTDTHKKNKILCTQHHSFTNFCSKRSYSCSSFQS